MSFHLLFHAYFNIMFAKMGFPRFWTKSKMCFLSFCFPSIVSGMFPPISNVHRTCCSSVPPVFLALAGTEDDIEEDALNKQLKKRLDDWLKQIKQIFVCPVVLFPVALDEDKVIIMMHQIWVQ